MDKYQTIVERSIEREMRERLRSIDDYRRTDRGHRERIEHDMLESIPTPQGGGPVVTDTSTRPRRRAPRRGLLPR